MPAITEARISKLESLVRQLQGYVRWDVGSPETVVDAPLGAIYLRTDTGAVYRKTTGLGTKTGWVTP